MKISRRNCSLVRRLALQHPPLAAGLRMDHRRVDGQRFSHRVRLAVVAIL